MEIPSIAVDVLEFPSVAGEDDLEAAYEDKAHEPPSFVSRLPSSASSSPLPLSAQRIAGPFEIAFGNSGEFA